VVDLPVDATSGEINNAIIAAMKLRRETVFEEVFVEGDVIRLLNTVCPFDVPVVTEV
jgi:ketopantoate hydroxymethyltransferase